MNNLFALVREDSSVAFVASMGFGEDTPASLLSEGMRSVAIPEGVPPEEVVSSWFYRDGWVKSAPRPSKFHKLDLLTYLWVDDRTLQDHKNTLWEQIKQSRTAAELAPFTYEGALYDANHEKVMGAVVLATVAAIAGKPFSTEWTLADNTKITLNGESMLLVGMALGQRTEHIYRVARSLREQIELVTDVKLLEGITWP